MIFPILQAVACLFADAATFGPFYKTVQTIGWVLLAIFLLMLIGFMGIFKKCREPTGAAFVPIWLEVSLARAAGVPAYYGLLAILPFVGIFFSVMIYIALVQKFGKPGWFAVFVILFPFIFLPLLGLGPEEFRSKKRKQKKKMYVIKRDFDDEEDREALEDEEDREARERKKARGDDDDEDDEDEDEEEDEERPQRRRRKVEADEDEEDERPRRRPAKDDDDEEEEGRPRARRRPKGPRDDDD